MAPPALEVLEASSGLGGWHTATQAGLVYSWTWSCRPGLEPVDKDQAPGLSPCGGHGLPMRPPRGRVGRVVTDGRVARGAEGARGLRHQASLQPCPGITVALEAGGFSLALEAVLRSAAEIR